MEKEPKYIVVIGASAGGLNSVIEVTAQLTPEMYMAVFVVLHVTPNSATDHLLQRIQKNTSYECEIARNETVVEAGHIYMADSDRHLVVKKGTMLLGEGPVENRWRPSIDVLFRSAAAAYDGRVIGIILSGLMQDGTAGMLAIKRSGGTLIVQDPGQAEYPDMPRSVLDNMEVDYCLPLEQIGQVLLEKSKNGVHRHTVPKDVLAEAEIAEKAAIGIDKLKEIGEKSLFSCPDCGGGLWEMKHESFSRYRCHTGHVYSSNELLFKQNEALENTLWVALRMMEERRNLLKKMSEEEKSKGWVRSAKQKKERELELHDHIGRLKQVLFDEKRN
jgi:two-component system chemotaxis response regulator CheB